MKLIVNFVIFIIILLSSNIAFSQLKVSSSGNSNQADPSSVLELESTDKGLLLPRISDLNLIQNPAPGLIVFLTADSKLYNYTASGWEALTVVDTTSLSNRIDQRALQTALVDTASNIREALVDSSNHLKTAINSKIDTLNGRAHNLNIVDSLTVNGIYIGRGKGGLLGNSAFGFAALRSNTSGRLNTAYGVGTLFLNTSGEQNTAIGSYSLNSNTTGGFNTAFGVEALYYNIGGNNNIAVGNRSLYMNEQGLHNTAFGGGALYLNTSGNSNTAIGTGALYSNTTGNYNTIIGSDADVSTNNLTNATAIGYAAIVDASHKIQLGNELVTSVATSGHLTASGLTMSATPTTISTATKSLVRDTDGQIKEQTFTATQTPSSAITASATQVGVASTNVQGAISDIATAVKKNTSALIDSSNNLRTAIHSKIDTLNGRAHNLNIVDSLTVNGIYIGRGIGRSGYINTNLAVGYQTSLSRGSGNTAIGDNSLTNNSGDNNVATGRGSLFANTTGFQNTAVGASAMRSNTTGNKNTGIGFYALTFGSTGSFNTAVGSGSLAYNNALGNSALGYNSLTSNTSGTYNTAIGMTSMVTNTSGFYNTGVGGSTLFKNSTGSYNTAIGTVALLNNTTGNRNIAIGDSAGYNSVAGNNNIFIGSKTGVQSDIDTAYTLNIGNEIFGRYVDQLLIPHPSFPEISLPAPAVQIAIGTKTYHASAMLTVAGTVAANGTVLSSDRRFKKDIQGINLGLKEVLQLKPSSYYWNTKNERMTHADSTKQQFGFIAQELEQVIPAVVSGDGSEKDYKSVNYEALIPVLTKAIQEQQEKIEALKKRIETLEKSGSRAGKSEERQPRCEE